MGIKKGSFLSFLQRSLADSNRRARFCRPLTKPLIQGTIFGFVCAKVCAFILPCKFYHFFLHAFLILVFENCSNCYNCKNCIPDCRYPFVCALPA